MTKPLKRFLKDLYKFYCDKIYYVRKIGNDYKILGYDYIDSDEEIVETGDHTVKVPNTSNVRSRYGQEIYYVDVINDKGVGLFGEDDLEDLDDDDSLGGGINDSILSSELVKKLNNYLGEGAKPDMFWFAMGSVVGGAIGLAIMPLLEVAGAL